MCREKLWSISWDKLVERKGLLMIVLIVLGMFGVKAAIAVYLIYRFAKFVTKKGDAIKAGYLTEIEELKKQLESAKRSAPDAVKKTHRRWPYASGHFPQTRGDA